MLKNGYSFIAQSRQYTIIKQLGSGANTIAYLAECKCGELKTKCILKEYSPRNNDDFETGKIRFLESGKTQNKIRQISALNNQTPPVSHIFETNGTAFIDIACYNGTTLDKVDNLTLPQYMALCETIAKTVGYYHKSGYLCLDLKPENIFILQNSPDDTITQLVEFIDFDSIHDLNNGSNNLFSYTREWAAPEQLSPYSTAKINTTSDIYTVGEIIFYLVFGRHSTDTEHRSFSKYPFESCKREYLKYTERPDVQALFSRIFKGTIRSSAVNRFKNIDELAKLLASLVELLEQKEYIIPILPTISPDFVGRDTEILQIAENLKINNILFISGIGGIGKSTLVKNFIARYRTEYDVITYLEFAGDIKHTFCNDMQLQISTISQQENETIDDYFLRKLKNFKRICGDKRVLFVLDNYTGKITKDLNHIIEYGYDIIIATRHKPLKNTFPSFEISELKNISDIFRLVNINLQRPLKNEEKIYFEEIIKLVHGHTLVIELIARQIAAGKLDIYTALELIRKKGFSRFSDEKIGSFKDGEEVYDTLSAVISALFRASAVNDTDRLALKILALLDVHGLEADLVHQFFNEISRETISKLAAEGWLYDDGRVRLHPVIAETVRGWDWYADDVAVMNYHQKMIDIYVGMSNDLQIKNIIREANLFKEQHPRHIIKAMYFDMLGYYYDVLLCGRYYPENESEKELLHIELQTLYSAIFEIEKSSDPRSKSYLTKYLLSLASILIRSYPKYYNNAAKLLIRANKIIEKNSLEHCEYCMVSAWYYTLAKPDIKRTLEFTNQAEKIAEKVISSDLELIDIVYIPAANCFYYHGKINLAVKKLVEAVNLCKKYPGTIPYIDKHAELLNCLIDLILAEKIISEKNIAICRALIKKIDQINETYKEQGVCRQVSPEIRKRLKM